MNNHQSNVFYYLVGRAVRALLNLKINNIYMYNVKKLYTLPLFIN